MNDVPTIYDVPNGPEDLPSPSEWVEIPYDPALKGPGVFSIKVSFNQEEIDRLYAGNVDRPFITRFIKEAALAEADRQAALADADSLAATD